MTKIVLGTMIVVCTAICVGFMAYRKRTDKIEVLDNLTLNHIFDWIDEVIALLGKEDNAKFRAHILSNKDTQELAKSKDKRIYAVILQKQVDKEWKVIETKIFYALSLDRALSGLENGELLEIPIEL